MQRAAECEHHVVRDVDDVRNRTHPGREQPRLQPRWRLAHLHVTEEAPDVTRAALEILDTDVERLVYSALGVEARHRCELGARQHRHLASDSVDGHQVGPVEEGLDLEDVLTDRQHVGERRARLEVVGEHHDPGVIATELQLALREDHPVGDLASQLALLDRERAAGHDAAGEHDGDRCAGAEIPGTADDRARLAVAHVDLRQLQLVGVRVLGSLEHTTDAKEPEVAVDVRDAAAHDAVDLAAREDELARKLLERPVESDVLAQPGDRDVQNCPSTRRSFSQNARRSGRPCRNMAMRSIPRPNA